MTPSAPAANPTTSNTNMPFGGYGQAQQDYSSASNILSNLPTQQAQTAKVNPSDTSILPSINPTYSIANAPTAQTINAGSYGTNLTGYNQAVQSAEQSLTGSENSVYNQAMQQYQQNVNQFGNLPKVYQQLATQYGLPGYQQDVNTLQNLLQNLNQDVNAQTTLGGGLMTQSARDEMYANEANPLNLALSSASRSYETGQTNVNNLLGAYETGLTNALKPEEMNISNLPELFNQTNQSAESGYNQGATAIQNTIQNEQEAQRIAVERAQAASQEAYNSAAIREINSNIGNGGNLASALSSGQLQGLSLKNAKAGGSAGYNFNVGGTPASVGTWASVNNIPINVALSYMAQNGDRTALAALGDVNNAGQVTQSIVNKYPSLFWANSGGGGSSINLSGSLGGSSPYLQGGGL